MPGTQKLRPDKRRGALAARLVRDTAGNTLAIMAAAMIPIVGMIGSGIDMGRAYVAQSKLQYACDAAALATRRAMGGGAITEDARNEGRQFFALNFPPVGRPTPVPLPAHRSGQGADARCASSCWPSGPPW